MNVTCPECHSVFRVDPAKVPMGGVRARCSVCGGVMVVPDRDDSAPTVVMMPTPTAQPAIAEVTSGEAWPEYHVAPQASAVSNEASGSETEAEAEPLLGQDAAGAERLVTPVAGLRRPFSPGATSGVPRLTPATPTMRSVAPRSSTPAGVLRAPFNPLSRTPFTRAPASPSAPAAPVIPPAGPPFGVAQPAAPPTARVASPSVEAPGSPPEHMGSARPALRPTIATAVVADPPAKRPLNPFLANDPSQKAKRLARALVSDMVAYLPQKRAEGLRNNTLKALFREEIKKSYEEYVDQIGREIAEGTTHFQDALNDVLSGGKKIF